MPMCMPFVHVHGEIEEERRDPKPPLNHKKKNIQKEDST